MITFKNIAGNKFLAVGTIQRKSALNGEKSLTGNLYDGKDVLNKIDKGWSLEFDGEPYVVTYFERNDNDNSVSFDAIHKFFWDMAKKVLYSSTEISGSHTIKWYLDQIFANTGYTYALNFSPAAIEKDNWGNKTRLSLFNDLITSIAGEFEINGTLISIFQNIGTDLSTIVRYGFNLSDMTLENDATSFVTYGEGFGAYADQEKQTGDRVHVTYTSPLAGVYGILQAEPIDDQRYTSQANLQAAVKAQVDASFSVSVQLSLYDLTAAGYPYKMANVGDWLTAVDENLDFKQRIRIISIDDEFSADGTRIGYTVTAGDIGLTKKYQDANASMASQVANAIVSAGQASTDANFALIAANGKLTAYYVGSYDELPTTANEGDLGWVTSGNGRLLYIYTKKADGSYYWEKRIDPEMGDQISAGVTEAVAQANAHTDEVKQGLSTDIATAKSQAASQASTAEANAKSAATSQFNQAQSTLSAAKSDLTNSIASEASARNAAVDAANSQAQTYANQAKSDINDTINAISVGGRNYILNSDVSTTTNITNFRTSIPVSSFSGKIITVSVQVDYDNITELPASSNFHRIMFEPTAIDGKTGNIRYFGTSITPKIGDSFHGRISTTYDLTNVNIISQFTGDASVNIWGQGIYVQGVVGTNVSVSRPKLEIANLPTDYSVAPEDTSASIAQVKITADGINNFVRDSSGNISSDFQTALSKISIITGSTLATSIQQQTATQITSALTDNNGKIISLINQDTSGVQIAGKNIVLNGDTTVTGAFKVSQANIANGAIGTAQIGDLAVTAAKIASLDVDKLTGNVSNFIQSNWNGAYSSTTIDSTGMQIGSFSADGYYTKFDVTGMTFVTTAAKYGYAKSHFGTDALQNSSGQTMAYGTEIRTGDDTLGFDYFAIKTQGTNNLEFGTTTNAGHVSLIVSPEDMLPIFEKGITFFDDVHISSFDFSKLKAGSSSQTLIADSTTFNSNDYPYFGDSRGKAGLAYGSTETYLISNGSYYNLSAVIRAFASIGAIKIPTSINSNGTVQSWKSISI